MVTTNAGQALHQGAHTVFLAMEQVRHSVAAASTEVAGLVRVCLPTSPATLLSLPLIKGLRERHPRIRLELFAGFSGHLEEMLTQKRYDIGLLYRSSPIKGLIVEPLVDEDLVLVGGFEPDNRDEVALADVADLRFVLPSRKHGLRQVVDRAFDAQGMHPGVLATLDDGASENVALPYSATCVASPESSKVAKTPALPGGQRERGLGELQEQPAATQVRSGAGALSPQRLPGLSVAGSLYALSHHAGPQYNALSPA